MDLKEKKLTSKEIYKGKIIDVYFKDKLDLKDKIYGLMMKIIPSLMRKIYLIFVILMLLLQKNSGQFITIRQSKLFYHMELRSLSNA